MAKRKSRKNKKRKDEQLRHQPFDYDLLVGEKILGHLRDLPNNKTHKGALLYKEGLEIDSRLQGYFNIDSRKIKSHWIVLELEKIPSGKKRRRDLYPLRIKKNSIIPLSEVTKPENLSKEVWSRLPRWLGSSFDKLFAHKEKWFVLHDHLDTLQDQIQRKWQEELEQQSEEKKELEKGPGKVVEEALSSSAEPPDQARLQQKQKEPDYAVEEALPSSAEPPDQARLQQKQKELEEEYDRLLNFQTILEQEREEFKRGQEEFEKQKQKMIARLEAEFVSFEQLRKDLKLKQQTYDDERRNLEKEQSQRRQAIEALKRKQERFTQWESAREKSLAQQRKDLKRQQEALDSKQKSLEKELSEQQQAQKDLKRKQEELEKEQSEQRQAQRGLERKREELEKELLGQQRSLAQQQEDLERQQKALDSQRRSFSKEQSNQQRSLAQQQEDLKRQQKALDSQRRSFSKEQSDQQTLLASQRQKIDSVTKEKQEELAQREEKLKHKENEIEEKQILLEIDEFKLTKKEKRLKEVSNLLEQEELEIREYSEESTAKVRQQQKELDYRAQSLQLKERQLNERSDQLRILQMRWGLSVEYEETAVESSLEYFRAEHELLNHVQRYINSQGFNFSEEVLINFYTCLKTNALVILAGLSGTGKSSLVRLFAEAIDAVFLPLSVKATWQDDADLLGFYHPEKKSYIPTPFLDFLVQAEANPDRLFIICLDEMNLSRVESYFSEFLSVLQQNKEHRKLRLYSKYEWDSRWRQIKNKRPPIDEKEAEINSLDEQEYNLRRYPYEIMIPPNLFFCGTINVDETTYPFSDKVLDRAQIIHFTDVIFYKVRQLQGGQSAKKRLSWEMFQQFCHLDTEITPEINDQWFNQLNQILRKAGFHFGYRVKRQIEMYCAQQSKLFTKYDQQEHTDAIDLQITQKILPKIKGIKTPRVKNMLHDLRLFCCRAGLRRAAQQIKKMEQMNAINYWEIFRYVD